MAVGRVYLSWVWMRRDGENQWFDGVENVKMARVGKMGRDRGMGMGRKLVMWEGGWMGGGRW